MKVESQLRYIQNLLAPMTSESDKLTQFYSALRIAENALIEVSILQKQLIEAQDKILANVSNEKV